MEAWFRLSFPGPKDFIITKPNPRELIISKRRWLRILQTFLVFGFFVVLLGFVFLEIHTLPSDLNALVKEIQSKLSEPTRLLVIIPLGLILMIGILRWLRNDYRDQSYKFDGHQDVLFKNDAPLVRFTEMQEIKLRTHQGGAHSATYYEVGIVLKNGKKLTIHDIYKESEALTLADDMARLTNLKVIRDEEKTFWDGLKRGLGK